MTAQAQPKTKRVFSLDHIMAKFFIEEPFFAAISRRVDKRIDRNIPTAGVRVNPHTLQFELVYNPEFFAGLTTEHQYGVLMHEFYHLLFDHVTSRMPAKELLTYWNYAADLAINSHISDKLPEFTLYPGRGIFKDWPVGQTSEYYFARILGDEKIKEKIDEMTKAGGDQGKEGQFDVHDDWENLPEDAREMLKDKMKRIMREARDECQSSNKWGSVSQGMKERINTLLSGNVDWKKVLRFFVQQSIKGEKFSTQKRINKRYPYIHPGRSVKRTASIAISIDQSGSVSDALLTSFFTELNSLSDIATFTVIPFDTEVDPDLVFKWRKGSKHLPERVKNGGTDFNAPTKYVNQSMTRFDGHIILTDLEAPVPVPSKCQRMWMTSPQHATSGHMKNNERIIVIPV